MGGIKVNVGKLSKDTTLSVMAYTVMEYLRGHGPLTKETITEAVTKEFPEMSPDVLILAFDALVDSRLIAYIPSANVYRMSQAGKLAFSIAKAVVKAVAHESGALTESDEPDGGETLQ